MIDILLALDPVNNYIGTALEGLDAFDRQLKRFELTDTQQEDEYEIIVQSDKKNTKQA